MKVTFGIVVYHEPVFLERCLSSVVDVADEIIVIHDGPCLDSTLAVAQKYTSQVIVGERLEGSDPHRITILEKSSNDWVFMIDADELLSPELTQFIKSFRLNEIQTDAAAFAFHWPLWDGEKEITHTNTRPCFFDRRRIWAVGLHNFPIHVIGKTEIRSEVLLHRPNYTKIGLGLVRGRLAKRVNRDAKRFLLGLDKLPVYNAHLVSDRFKKQFYFLIKHPLLAAWFNAVKHFLGSYRHVWLDGRAGLIISLQLGMYQYYLGKKIWQIQNHK